MTSINRFSQATDREKITAAARAVLRKGEWSETAIIRLLNSQFKYYQSHNFTPVDTEGLQAAVLAGDSKESWGESPQVVAYKTREPGFHPWNFLEFTLAAAQMNEYGLTHPVDKHTLMPRLVGVVPPWLDRTDLLGSQSKWVAAWDVFENVDMGNSVAVE